MCGRLTQCSLQTKEARMRGKLYGMPAASPIKMVKHAGLFGNTSEPNV